MDLSCIICTYNRADALRKTLESLCDLANPPHLSWELILVDNNSTDATRATCDAFNDRLPLRYVFESKQGLSAARNCGIRTAAGELLVFTDDDVDVDPHWLARLDEAARRRPEIAFFGGKILPRWEAEPPRWLAENSATLLKGVTMHLDQGDAEQVVGPNENTMVFGANMAFRRSAFRDGLLFHESLGRQGAELIHGEESEIVKELARRGQSGLYVPNAVVYHRTPANRMTEKYVRDWFKGAGITKVRRGAVANGARIFRAPVRAWGALFFNALRYVLARWMGPSRLWLGAERKMATAWGIISESRRVHGTRRTR